MTIKHILVISFAFLSAVGAFVPSALSFYKKKSNLKSFQDNLKEIHDQWDAIKSSGVQKFIVKEIIAAEKNVANAMTMAEKAVEGAIKDNASKLNAIQSIVDTMKAAETVTEAAATSAKADSLAMNDLALASSNVVESIKVSEKAVQSIIDKLSSNSNVDSSDVETLEKTVLSLLQSMEFAKIVADNLDEVASQDVSNLQSLDSSSSNLFTEINDVEQLAEQTTQATASNSQIIEDLSDASKDVLEEMQAAEDIATSVAKIAQSDAKAVSALQTETDDIVDSIRSFETAIKEASSSGSISSDSNSALQNVAAKIMEQIKIDEGNVELVTDVVSKDAKVDAVVVETLKRADDSIEEMVKAAEGIVQQDEVSTTELDSFETLTETVAESVKAVEKAAMECLDCEVDHNLEAVEGISATSESYANGSSDSLNSPLSEPIDPSATITSESDANDSSVSLKSPSSEPIDDSATITSESSANDSSDSLKSPSSDSINFSATESKTSLNSADINVSAQPIQTIFEEESHYEVVLPDEVTDFSSGESSLAIDVSASHASLSSLSEPNIVTTASKILDSNTILGSEVSMSETISYTDQSSLDFLMDDRLHELSIIAVSGLTENLSDTLNSATTHSSETIIALISMVQ